MEEVARIISRCKALEFTEFRHPGLGVSLYNVDFSKLFNFPDHLKNAVKLLIELIKDEVGFNGFHHIGGVLTKGLVLSSIISYEVKKPLIVFDKRGIEVYGGIGVNDKLILVDDVIMTGNTLVKCIKRVKKAMGGEIIGVFVILDRMYGGRDRIEEMGVKVYSLVDIRELIEKLHSMGEIGMEEMEVVLGEIIE